MTKRPLAALLFLLGGTLLLGTGCHPGDVNEVSELDVAATFYAQDADFGAYLTYAMEDTIYDLDEISGEDPGYESDLDRRFDAEMLEQVQTELANRGYQRVALDGDPDLRVGMGALTREGELFYTYYPWWGYHPGYWYPAWGSVDFTAGSVFIFMADWVNRDPENEEVDPIWTGSIAGVLESSATATRERIERGLNQVFAQSPYLKTTAEGKAPRNWEVQ
jgi:hypothetical protein